MTSHSKKSNNIALNPLARKYWADGIHNTYGVGQHDAMGMVIKFLCPELNGESVYTIKGYGVDVVAENALEIYEARMLKLVQRIAKHTACRMIPTIAVLRGLLREACLKFNSTISMARAKGEREVWYRQTEHSYEMISGEDYFIMSQIVGVPVTEFETRFKRAYEYHVPGKDHIVLSGFREVKSHPHRKYMLTDQGWKMKTRRYETKHL